MSDEARTMQAPSDFGPRDPALSRFLEVLPTIAWFATADAECTYVNPAWTAFTGMPVQESLGYGWLQAFHPALRDELLRSARAAIARQEPFRIESRLRDDRDGWYWVAIHGAPYPGETSGAPGYIATINDISSRKEAEQDRNTIMRTQREQAELLSSLVQDAPIGIAVFSSEGRLLLANGIVRRRLFSHHDKLLGLSLHDLLPPEQAEQALLALPRILRGDVLRFQGRELEADGDPSFWTIEARAFGDDRILVVGIDVSEQVLARRELEQTLDEAERARAELQVSESRFRTMGETIPFGIWEADASGRCTYVSQSFLDMVGRQMDDVVGDGWFSSIVPEDSAAVAEEWERCIRTGGEWERELRFIDVQGELKTILGRGRPVRDTQGRIVSWVGLSLDITARKRTSERLQVLADLSRIFAESLDYETRLAKAAAVIVGPVADWCIIDLVEQDGSLRRVASAHADPGRREWTTRLLDFAPDLDGDTSIARVLRFGEPVLIRRVPGDMIVDESNSPEHFEVLSRLEPRSVVSLPMRSGERIDGIWTFGFSRRGMHYERSDLGFLSVVASRASVALENARLYEASQEASRAKDRFIAMLSHELRTPMTPLIGALELLKEEPVGAEAQALLTIIERNALQEARLVDDLLDLSRVLAGKVGLVIERIDLHALISEVLDTIIPEIADRHQRFDISLNAPLHGIEADPARIRQVLLNLLQNAVKFTEDGGTISLATELTADGSHVVVIVQDTGIGIEPEALERVFAPFEQAGSDERHRSGLGLGLAICRMIVDMHRGSLTAESEGRNRGTRMVVSLPIASGAPPVTVAPTIRRVSRDRSNRVLLVDDHADTLRVVELFLRKRGYDVYGAGSVAEALALADALEFNLLISDIRLPDGTGLDLLRAVRARQHIAAIAISGYGSQEDVDRSLSAGFAEHLVKPVTFRALFDAAERAAAGKGRGDEGTKGREEW